MSADLHPLNRSRLAILVSFYEAGGTGELDTHGRVVSVPSKHPMQGDMVSWLVFVARGLIAGEMGKILLTEEGRAVAEKELAGRTREAS